MLKQLIEYLKQHKQDFAPTQQYEKQVGYGDTNGPSTISVDINDLDMKDLWRSIEEFESTFQKGGENSHRNPLVKD